jgi:hypothetical protein
MSTTELERRLVDALQRHAEDAMSSTNTEKQLVELLDRTRTENRRRRRWYAGGLVAAAAVAALAFWWVARDADHAQPEPIGPISPEQVATDYLDAAAAYDLDRAESHFAGDADLHEWGGVDGWRSRQVWNQAVHFDMDPGACSARPTIDGAGSVVECPYVFSGMGSNELGFGPYDGSSYVFTVRDGAIVTLSDQFEFEGNNYSGEVWEPFAEWIHDNYPQDFRVMYADHGSDMVTTDESIALWHQHLDGYIAAKLAEQGG